MLVPENVILLLGRKLLLLLGVSVSAAFTPNSLVLVSSVLRISDFCLMACASSSWLMNVSKREGFLLRHARSESITNSGSSSISSHSNSSLWALGLLVDCVLTIPRPFLDSFGGIVM